MQAPTKNFHGYYIIPCFTEKCCSTLQDVEVLDQKPKNSFTIDSLLSRPAYSTLSSKSEELTSTAFPVRTKHLLSGSRMEVIPHLTRLRTSHPYVDLRQAGPTATFRAIVADSQPQISRRQVACPNEKPKRIRTVFTPEQLDRLEHEFEHQQYMVGTERFYLASELGLTETQVKVWFQNRRIKWRRQNIETIEEARKATSE